MGQESASNHPSPAPPPYPLCRHLPGWPSGQGVHPESGRHGHHSQDVKQASKQATTSTTTTTITIPPLPPPPPPPPTTTTTTTTTITAAGAACNTHDWVSGLTGQSTCMMGSPEGTWLRQQKAIGRGTRVNLSPSVTCTPPPHPPRISCAGTYSGGLVVKASTPRVGDTGIIPRTLSNHQANQPTNQPPPPHHTTLPPPTPSVLFSCPDGPVVKAPTPRAGDTGIAPYFPLTSHTVNLGASGSSARRLGAVGSVLGLVGPVSVYCDQMR